MNIHTTSSWTTGARSRLGLIINGLLLLFVESFDMGVRMMKSVRRSISKNQKNSKNGWNIGNFI